jgi:hypothetical protein
MRSRKSSLRAHRAQPPHRRRPNGKRGNVRPPPEGLATAQTREVAARKQWHALDPITQAALLADIVETRSPELRQAYPDVIAVGYGRRTRGKGPRHKVRLGELTLKFMVPAKWKKGSRSKRPERPLPDHILAYQRVANERRLLSIPTDIEDRRDYRQCRPQSVHQIRATTDPDAVTGSIACTVRIPGDPDHSLYAISAAHVLDLFEIFWPNLPGSVVVTDDETGAAVGHASSYAGPLQDADDGPSFDAALALVEDPTAVQTIMNGLRLTQVASSASQIPESYHLSTSRGLLLASKATHWDTLDQVLEYQASNGAIVRIEHPELIESDAATLPGDSGAPVVSIDGTTLFGMNIYGGAGVSFMIPAYALLAGGNYSGLPSGVTLQLA